MYNHDIQMLLRDNSRGTQVQTEEALQTLQINHPLVFGNKYKSKSLCGVTALEYRGHLCSSYDVESIFRMDESGALRKNVVGFNVFYPAVMRERYYDVDEVMEKIKRERQDREVSSGFVSLFREA